MTLTKPINLLFLHRSDFIYLFFSDPLFTFLLLFSPDINAANSTNETEIRYSLSLLLVRASGGFPVS